MLILFSMSIPFSSSLLSAFDFDVLTPWHRYCNRVHKSQETSTGTPGSPSTSKAQAQSRRPSSAYEDPDSAPPSIYHTLLSLYLKPPPPNKPNLAPALDLLSKHGSRLPAASTLSLIPDGLPIADLESYFRGRIRAANSAVNESRVVAGLRQTELVASQALLLLGDGVPGGQGGRNRRVVISDERVCGVCHKRLGGSVVAVLPDNTVVHYGCLGRVPSVAGGSASAQRTESSRAGAWGRTGALASGSLSPDSLSPGGLSRGTMSPGGLSRKAMSPGAELASGGWG